MEEFLIVKVGCVDEVAQQAIDCHMLGELDRLDLDRVCFRALGTRASTCQLESRCCQSKRHGTRQWERPDLETGRNRYRSSVGSNNRLSQYSIGSLCSQYEEIPWDSVGFAYGGDDEQPRR